MIKFYIESKNGHDEVNVEETKVAEKVNEDIKQGNWATLEKTDGTTETLTKEVPKQEWKNVFGESANKVKSVTETSKMKGG